MARDAGLDDAAPPPSTTTTTLTVSNFRISTTKRPILNATEIEAMSASIGITPPEMIFGNNEVRVEYIPAGEVKWGIVFNAHDALDLVDKTGSSMLKVAYSDAWQRQRERVHEGIKEFVRPFDWSYTTAYRGSVDAPTTTTTSRTPPPQQPQPQPQPLQPPQFTPTTTKLPLALLSAPDPIRFFDDVILYEDELADNGMSLLSVKIRVMPHRLFILSRFFLRLDGVLWRIRDTRVYISWGHDVGEVGGDRVRVLRQYTEKEGKWETVMGGVKGVSGTELPALMRDAQRVGEWVPVVRQETEEVVLD
ncbi:type 2A phosphatase activator tip41 [Peziza echinospora]|nr:type 2A phosphatase activator tip41 [Peziza echinospora]